MQRIVLLKGINVRGKNVVRMNELTEQIGSKGGSRIKAWYRSSGNLLLEGPSPNPEYISGILKKPLQRDVNSFVRTRQEFCSILRLNPFEGHGSARAKKCVSFLSKAPEQVPTLPVRCSAKAGEVELFRVEGKQAYSLWTRKNGTFGDPNQVVERVLRVDATTRSWSTIEGMGRRFGLTAS